MSVLSSDTVELAIKNLPKESCLINSSLSIEDTSPGFYTLSFSGTYFNQTKKTLLLSDTYLDSTILINQNGLYGFLISDTKESFGNKRFELKFITETTEPTITIQGNQLLSNATEGNQWLLNGEEIEGADMQSFIPLTSGEYQVRTDHSDCFAISPSVSFIVTGIETNPSIEFYPNPTTNEISINGLKSSTRYTIYSTLGEVIQQEKELAVGNHTIQLTLASGVYILMLENSSQFFRSKLIVKK